LKSALCKVVLKMELHQSFNSIRYDDDDDGSGVSSDWDVYYYHRRKLYYNY